MASRTPSKSSHSALVGKGSIKSSTPSPEKKSTMASNSAKMSPDKVTKFTAKTKRTPNKPVDTIAGATNKSEVNGATNEIAMIGSNTSNGGPINKTANDHLEAAYRSYSMPALGFGHESNAMVAPSESYDNTLQGNSTLPSSNTAGNGNMADYNNALAFFRGTADVNTLDASDDSDGSYDDDNDEALSDGESGHRNVEQEGKKSNDTPTKAKPRKYIMQKAKVDYHPNGRRKGRKLVLWHRARMIEKLVLHIVYECNRLNVVLPWNDIVSRLSPGSSGQSALQMLNKLRDVMVVEGHLVPPLMGKKGHGDDQGVRGYIRDLDGPAPTTVRVVDWNEEVEDLKESLNLEGVIRGSGKYKRVPGAPKVRDPSLSVPGQRRNRLPIQLQEAQRLEMEEKKRKKSARQSAYLEARAKAQGITVAEVIEQEKSKKPLKPVVTPSKSKQVNRSRSLSSSSIDPADLTSDEEYTPTLKKGKNSGRGNRYKRQIKKESVSEHSDLTDFVPSEDEVATPAPVVSLLLSPRLLAQFPEGQSGVKRYVAAKKNGITSTDDNPNEGSDDVKYSSDYGVYEDETQVVNRDEDEYADEDEEVMSVYSDETHNGEVVINKAANAGLLGGQTQDSQIGNEDSLSMYAGFGNTQLSNIYSANTGFYDHIDGQYLQPTLNNPGYLPQHGFDHSRYDNQGMTDFCQTGNIMTPNNNYQVAMNAAHPAHYSNMNYVGQSPPRVQLHDGQLAGARSNAPRDNPGSLKLCGSFVPSSEASQSTEHTQETGATSFQDEDNGVESANTDFEDDLFQ
ncbi:hypothetical protein B7494_g5526 [Chlorociboria aeruginascens]|nr:hypothetical protein B7494_g5526 [Chlorociboria aeruginascens]